MITPTSSPSTRATFSPSSILQRKSGGRPNRAGWCSSCPLRTWSLWRVSFNFFPSPPLFVYPLFFCLCAQAKDLFFWPFFFLCYCALFPHVHTRIESNYNFNLNRTFYSTAKRLWKFKFVFFLFLFFYPRFFFMNGLFFLNLCFYLMRYAHLETQHRSNEI